MYANSNGLNLRDILLDLAAQICYFNALSQEGTVKTAASLKISSKSPNWKSQNKAFCQACASELAIVFA